MNSKIFIFTWLTLHLFSCGGRISNTQLITLPAPATNTAAQTLVITQVKKPWYAWRSLVAGKMEKSIPEYQSITGLQEKYYSFTQDHSKFGGIYFWQQKQDAEKWFNKDWFDRVEKQYGEKGIVDYYTIKSTTQIANIPLEVKNLYAVVSYRQINDLAYLHKAEGLVKYAQMTDANQEKCVLTIWKDKKTALKTLPLTAKNQYFDVPLFIVN